MRVRTSTAGPLRVREVGAERGPAVVLCHGYGAPGEDLVGLASAIGIPELRYVFPEGPLSIDTGWIEGRAWWPVDMMRLQMEIASGRGRRWDPDAIPEGMAEARRALRSCLDALQLDLEKTVIGGFSQGAMITTDLVLGEKLPFAGLAILSGSYVDRHRWLPGMKGAPPVFQSHGLADPILPFGVAEMLHQALLDAGVQAEFVRAPGGHEIRPIVTDGLRSFVHARVGFQG
ncbi:MAG: alpha/beta hydrolase, partial [Polyangiales bacterium]